MRNTPLDEPGGGDREGDDSPDDAAASAGGGGFLGRARTAVSRVGEVLGRLFGPLDTADDTLDEEETEETVERRRATRQIDRTTATVERDRTGNRPVLADRSAEKPVPASSDEGPRDRPELVARWQDDRLTLSEPNETGARLSSDTWADVDP